MVAERGINDPAGPEDMDVAQVPVPAQDAAEDLLPDTEGIQRRFWGC